MKTILMTFAVVLGSVCLVSFRAASAEIEPTRLFVQNNRPVAQMAFNQVDLSLTFDVQKQQTHGYAWIDFTAHAAGNPFLLMKAPVDSIKLDGESVSFESVTVAKDTAPLIIWRELEPETRHTLVIEYHLDSDTVGYSGGGVQFLTAMGDLQWGNFFEDFGPTSYEDDHYGMTLELVVEGSTKTHRLFTNGTETSNCGSRWTVNFSDRSNSSTFFVHLTSKTMRVRRGTYHGLDRDIPWVIYSTSRLMTWMGARRIEKHLSELERDYGPYFHPAFVALISGQGGMEYPGAAITSIGALDHEALHSWFGRGVMPSDGRSGWLDEAVAAWRDNGYPRGTWPPNRAATNLATFSEFERFTPRNCYSDGSKLMSELDGYFGSHGEATGMKPVLAKWFSLKKGQSVTTEEFRDYLELVSGENLHSVFSRYVYGNSSLRDSVVVGQLERGHPPKLTKAEVRELR